MNRVSRSHISLGTRRSSGSEINVWLIKQQKKSGRKKECVVELCVQIYHKKGQKSDREKHSRELVEKFNTDYYDSNWFHNVILLRYYLSNFIIFRYKKLFAYIFSVVCAVRDVEYDIFSYKLDRASDFASCFRSQVRSSPKESDREGKNKSWKSFLLLLLLVL